MRAACSYLPARIDSPSRLQKSPRTSPILAGRESGANRDRHRFAAALVGGRREFGHIRSAKSHVDDRSSVRLFNVLVILNRRADHLFHPVEAAYFRGANNAGLCISNIAVNAPRLCDLFPFDESDQIGPQQLLATEKQLGFDETNRLCRFWEQEGLLASEGRLASSHQLEARLPNLQRQSSDLVASLDESDSVAIRSFVERFNRLVVVPVLRDISRISCSRGTE